jgi:hypothetical protein
MFVQASLAVAWMYIRATARLACSYSHATARLACTNIPMRYTVYEMMLLMMDW